MTVQLSELMCGYLVGEAHRFRESGKLDLALARLLEAYASNSEDSHLALNIGTLFWELGSSTEAVKYCSKALLLSPGDPNPREVLSEIYERLGDTEAARSIRAFSDGTEQKALRATSESTLSGSWANCAQYLRVGSGVTFGAQSACDVRYRPNNPSVCVEIGDGSTLLGALSILKQGASIKIGKRCRIEASVIIAAARIEIGDDVVMDWGVTVMDNDSHSMNWDERSDDVLQCGRDWIAHPTDFIRNKDWQNVQMDKITVCNRAWIGFDSIILKGVTIGEGAVVLPGSKVVRDVDPYTVVSGTPATFQKKLESAPPPTPTRQPKI